MSDGIVHEELTFQDDFYSESLGKEQEMLDIRIPRSKSSPPMCILKPPPEDLIDASQNLFGFEADHHVIEFRVKKNENVFEKLGSKKATFNISIDTVARTVTFVNESPQVFSCAAVIAKCTARLGLHLKIQTGKESLNKRFSFLSPEDRERFLHYLESSKLIPNGAESVEISLDFELNDGELILQHVHRVTNLVIVNDRESAIQGVMHLTNFRISFTPYDRLWKFSAFQIPLAAVNTVTREGWLVILKCKDIRTIRLAMHDAYTKTAGFNGQKNSPNIRWLNLMILNMRPPSQIGALFAFNFAPVQKPNTALNGWLVYSPVAEYQRLGFLDAEITYPEWRLLKNARFRFSPTYPQLLVVPASMTEEQLVESARFRSKARLPAVVWRHFDNKCVLARSSQPNYGMAGNRSEADRRLLAEFRNVATNNTRLYIIDARKPIATQGNRLKGKGVENPQHYDGAHVEFIGIANIHKMRESITALRDLVSPQSISDGDKNYHTRLENTRWLKHIMRVLAGSSRIAEILHEQGASVLVHCSDGWDRTPQLVSTAQLILDPYYRTIRGFIVLVEKEWCSFGHKFTDRIGVGIDASLSPSERSPVMIQWLDCVWQMICQFPSSFEFNQVFLLHIADALTSGLYGTFIYNSERERMYEKVWERTQSVWTSVLADPETFTNPIYRPTKRPIYPRANLKKIVLWEDLYSRWDPERRPGYEIYQSRYDDEHGVPMRPEMPTDARTRRKTEEDALHVDVDIQMSEKKEAASSDSDSGSDDEDEILKKFQQGSAERSNQRKQTRVEQESGMNLPASERIEQLNQLLNQSLAREIRLEAILESMKK